MKHARIKTLVAAGIATVMTATSAFAYTASSAVSLNVRAGAGVGYPVVDVLYPGEVVDVRSCNSYGWCYIVHSGPDGWVSARYLEGAYQRPYYRDDRDAAAFALPFLFALPFILNNHDRHYRPRNHRYR